MLREKAYQLVQKNSIKAWEKNLDFKNLVLADKEIRKILSLKEIKACFSLEPYLKKIDYIFKRVLADES